MDDRQFDAFSRTLANRGSRRAALKAGGAGAALLGMIGLGRARPATAQDDDTGGSDATATSTSLFGLPGNEEDDAQQPAQQAGGRCRFRFEANVRIGPSTEPGEQAQITGLLELAIGENGGIDASTLTLDDGPSYPVIGQASGRALSLRIQIGDDTLVAVGVGTQNARSCGGEFGGPTTGPVRGDLGDWIAVPDGASGTNGSGSGQSGTTPSPTGTVTSSQTPTATATAPADCDVECMEPLVIDPMSCTCVCPGGLLACGPVCCPIGSVCADEGSGECSCPPGSSLCVDTCVSCPAGQMVDDATCQCVAAPCPSGQDLCGGVCVDIVNSTTNCGSCGNTCGTGVPCIAGTCTCPPGYDTCATGCKDLATDAMNCGTCGNVCGSGTSCMAGDCA